MFPPQGYTATEESVESVLEDGVPNIVVEDGGNSELRLGDLQRFYWGDPANDVYMYFDGDTMVWMKPDEPARADFRATGRIESYYHPIRALNDSLEAVTSGYGFGCRYAENLAGKTGNFSYEVRVDDGTNTTSGNEGLCLWNGTAWVSVEDGSTFT